MAVVVVVAGPHLCFVAVVVEEDDRPERDRLLLLLRHAQDPARREQGLFFVLAFLRMNN